MPGRRGSKSKGKGSSDKGSRQKDRDDEKVNFETVGEPVLVDRPGSDNFVQVQRTEVIGQDSGKVKTEFVQVKPGFYNDDDKPCYNKKCKECGKAPGVTFAPTMSGEVIMALEGTMTEEEFEEFEKENAEDEE